MSAGGGGGATVTARAPSLVTRAADLVFGRREASIALVAVLLVVYFGAMRSAFLSINNVQVASQFTARVAIIAAGQVMLLICGQIDLSAGHVFALAPFIMLFGIEAGLPLLVAVLVAVAVAGLVGLVNGIITVRFGLPSFITTLGMFFFLSGTTLIISGGRPTAAPRGGVLVGILGGFPFSGILWAIVIMAVMHVVLTNSPWGVYTFATGGNPLGAREAGVPTSLIKIGNFMLTSMLAGFAGILEAQRLGSADPLGGGAELMFQSVAAAVIGGTALAGGSGTVIGGVLGALVLGVLRNGFTLMGISSFTMNVVVGLAIIIAMILNMRLARLRRAPRPI